MREIKFRGMNNETGEFVYGYYTKLLEGIRRIDAIITEVDGELTRFYIHSNKTIGQFTGLKDKNGAEIYEGDLVRVCNNKNGNLEVVFINQYEGGWNLKFEDKTLSLGARKQDDIEVVGNIHQ